MLLLARLLAKFLGFISFLPYRTSEAPSREIQESAVALRSKVKENFKRRLRTCRDVVHLFNHGPHPAERPGAGCVRSAAGQCEEEAHHPDGALAGGVPVHVG